MYVGQTASFTAYAAGGINWWDGAWRWANGSSAVGTFSPANHGTGPTYVTNFTATTPGNSLIRFIVHEDNNIGQIYCEGTKQISVYNPPPTSTPLPPPPPNPPTIPVGSCPSPGTHLNLSWNNSPGATNYAIRVDFDDNGNGVSDDWAYGASCAIKNNPASSDICNDNIGNTTTYIVNNNGSSRVFSWWVHAWNASGWSAAVGGPIVTCNPLANFNGSCTYNAGTGTYQGNLSWSQMAGAQGYLIRVNDTSNGWTGACNGVGENPGDICTSLANPATVSYTFPAQPGRTYSAWAHTYNGAGTGPPSSVTFSCQTGNIQAVGRLMTGATQCIDAKNGSGLNGTQIGLTGVTPLTQTQSGNTPVVWNNTSIGAHSFTFTPPAGYSLATLCRERASSPGVLTPAGSFTDGTVYASDTTTYYAGFVPNVAWTQVSGGDAISCGDITQPIPQTATNRLLNLTGAGGYPGIVTYSPTGSFDIDPNPAVGQDGRLIVSTTNWLTRQRPENICTYNWYTYFGNQFDMITPTASTVPNPLAVTKADLFSGQTTVVKKLDGNITTQGNITINSGESLVLFVNGTLTLGGRVTRTGTGFVAFITSQGITVGNSVGSSDQTPSLDGIYITQGPFRTGTGTLATTERLVVRGTVVANSIVLQRSLGVSGNNTTTPAELFVYDPELLFLMPEKMRDVKVFWSEVEP